MFVIIIAMKRIEPLLRTALRILLISICIEISSIYTQLSKHKNDQHLAIVLFIQSCV